MKHNDIKNDIILKILNDAKNKIENGTDCNNAMSINTLEDIDNLIKIREKYINQNGKDNLIDAVNDINSLVSFDESKNVIYKEDVIFFENNKFKEKMSLFKNIQKIGMEINKSNYLVKRFPINFTCISKNLYMLIREI